MAPNSERIQTLLEKCKSADTDAKSDAIGKLQLEFDDLQSLPDPDPVLSTLKPLLRSANPHVSISVLHALPPLIRLLTTEHAVRAALVGFMAPGTGGLLERLGDARDGTRKVAREGVEGLCERCLAVGGTGSTGTKGKGKEEKETLMGMFERYLKEGGFGSKVPRVREQSLLLLLSLRPAHPTLPLRPYLTPLIETLQDPDPSVRQLGATAIPVLFGPSSGVSDGARTELKREATKRGVRKGIWDGVWERVCGVVPVDEPLGAASSDGVLSAAPSESGARSLPRSTSQSAIPVPSAASVGSQSRPASRMEGVMGVSDADILPVYVASARDLELEFVAMLPAFAGKETEENWLARENAVQRVRGMLKADVWRRLPEAFLAGLKGGFLEATVKALTSLRTTLGTATCTLYGTLSTTLGVAFDPLIDTVYLPLLRLSASTKKLTQTNSQTALTTILEHASPLSRLILPALFESVNEKNPPTRQYATMHLRTWLTAHGRGPLEHFQGGVESMERSLRKALGDANPAVRNEGRKLYWAFKPLWPDRAKGVFEGLDVGGKRAIEKADPGPTAAATSTAVEKSPTPSKKSSVAATIAAHRARVNKSPGPGGVVPTMARAVSSPPSVPSTAPASASASSGAAKSRSPPTPPTSRHRPSTPTRPSPLSTSHSNRSPSHIPQPSVHTRTGSDSASSAGRPRVASPLGRGIPAVPYPHARTASEQPVRARSPLGMVGGKSRESSKLSSATTMVSGAGVGVGDVTTEMEMDGPDADETLLMATRIPVPEEGEDDLGDETFNPFTFSPTPSPASAPAAGGRIVTPTPRPGLPHSRIPISPRRSTARSTSISSTTTSTNPLFSPPVRHLVSSGQQHHQHQQQAKVPQSVIEDALRAQAEQAESAADRLLELVEPDEDEDLTLPAPAVKAHLDEPAAVTASLQPDLGKEDALPKTPANNRRAAAILQQAAMFKDSPTLVGTPGPVDVLGERKHETGWWQKKAKLSAQSSPMRDNESAHAGKLAEGIVALSAGTATKSTLHDLAVICSENPCENDESFILRSPSVPNGNGNGRPHGVPDLWQGGKQFDALFTALQKFLVPTRPEDVLEYGLVVLWEMLEYQPIFLEGQVMEIFTVLLDVRWCNGPYVVQATNAIRDAVTARVDPVFGVAQVNASLRAFLQRPTPSFSNDAVRCTIYAFGLVAIGKFIMRLPPEILEDELPRLKTLLLSALSDKSSEVREAASIVVVAAQLVLQDETHLFTLMDGLEDAKKNLLTYYFERYKTRNAADSVAPRGPHVSGHELVEKEMRRLDLKATPPRTALNHSDSQVH